MLTPDMDARWRSKIATIKQFGGEGHESALLLAVDAELTRLRALVDDEEDILPSVGTPDISHRSVGRKVSSRASPPLVIEGLEVR